MSRNFENWLDSYRLYTSNTESPTACHTWTGIGTVAGALRRQVWFDQGHFKWHPNFYIILVGPPGVIAKSTTINIGGKLLRKVHNVKIGPASLTPQALTQAMTEARIQVIIKGQEHLGTQAEMITMSCMTFLASELGSLLDPRDNTMINVLTDLWDGNDGSWEKLTKTQGSDKIENPFINILACTTPAWIADNMPRGLIGGGFTSRCIFVYGDTKHQLVAYPGLSADPKIMALRDPLLEDLQQISKMQGEYTLSQDALLWGTAWYKKHWTTKHEHLSKEDFDGYLSRKQGHIHKIAMVLAACRRDYTEITASDLIESEALLNSAEKHWEHIFSRVGAGDSRRTQERVVATVRRFKSVDYETLYRLFYSTTTLYDFENALKSAKAAGYIRITQQKTQTVIVWKEQKEDNDKQHDGVDSKA